MSTRSTARPESRSDRYRNHPRLRDLDLPPLGDGSIFGPVLAKTLLVAASATGSSTDGLRLVAWDKRTGEERGSVDLPAGTTGTPMMYMVDDTQYLVMAIGGTPPELIAFALPETTAAGGQD